MFAPRRGKASINPGGSPQFQAQYIGNVDTFRALGQGCTRPLVQRLWDRSPGEKYLPRVMLTLNASGLILKDLDKPKNPDMKFDIQNISYCSAESGVHDRVFAWICQTKTGQRSSEHKLLCHAVLCSSKEKAQTIALVLSRAFQIAYRDWKNEREKRERIVATHKKHQQFDKASSQISHKSENRPSVAREEEFRMHTDLGPTLSKPERDSKDNSLSLDADTKVNDRLMYEFNFEHREMIDSLNSIPKSSEASDAYLEDVAVSQMNIVEEDEISFTDNNLVAESVSQKL